MRILMLFTYNKSFLSSYFQNIAQELAQKNEVLVYSWKKGRDKVFKEGNVIFHISHKASFYKRNLNLLKFILNNKPDLIFTNFSYTNIAVLSTFFIKPKIAIMNHTLLKQLNKTSPFKIFIKKILFQKATLMLANSQQMQKELVNKYNLKKEKVRIIPFWSDIDSIAPSPLAQLEQPNQFKVGIPGRLEPSKNQQLILETLPEIFKRTEFKCFFAGTGSMMDELQNIAKAFNVQDRTIFLGALNSQEMVSFYLKCDVIILPSLNEAFGLVFIEAISLGAPVIVSNRFGALDFLGKDKKDIIQFNPESSQSLSDALKHFLSRDKKTYSSRLIELYQKYFSKSSIIKQISQITGSI